MLKKDFPSIEHVCKLLSDEWEANFWHLFQCVCCEKTSDRMTSKFDSYLENDKFRKIESLKLSSFDVQNCNRCQWNNHIRTLIMLNENDKAVSLLLSGAGNKISTDSNNASDYYADCLKACVLSGGQSHILALHFSLICYTPSHFSLFLSNFFIYLCLFLSQTYFPYAI
uniref:Uncharacterized protein n=1 Tax=Romanomermis culicivorax TaxID=13658 RepID=A0A915JW50_ROMCU